MITPGIIPVWASYGLRLQRIFSSEIVQVIDEFELAAVPERPEFMNRKLVQSRIRFMRKGPPENLWPA
jgi:hypothetical protein